MSINRTEYGNPLGFSVTKEPPSYSPPAKGGHSGSITSPRLESDEHLPHTCPQCEMLDPSWQCDDCEGCENCIEFCPHCENPTCNDCCGGHG